ncbi:MAG TPA: GNAT family N-acetyltransferase [Smithellaceae bacterium]|nr:GNAT family N-acetyltransferase [Smithellaceae bacterium]
MVDDTGIETWTLDDGKKLSLRRISPADAAREQEFVRNLSDKSRYLRFHGVVRELSRKDLEKFTNPDPRNSEALIVLYNGEKHEQEIGVARFVINPDGTSCEFAIVVADEWQNRGLGSWLMKALIKRAQWRGLKRICGYVLETNLGMRQLAKGLGFTETRAPDDISVLLVTKNL